jgi:5'-3' exonuclease
MEKIKITGGRVLLVDMGYLFFYRLHATVKYLTFKLEREPEMGEVLDMYASNLDSQLKKYIKKHKITTTIFCKDTRQADIWRHDYWGEYKATRGVADDFIHEVQEVFYKAIIPYGKMLSIDRLEADDLLALTIKKLVVLKEPPAIFVMANDSDLYQLLKYPSVTILDATGKNKSENIDGEKFMMMKILMGDKSDNIPSVAKGCGKKTAEKLSQDPIALDEYLKKDVQRQEAFTRNRMLVCFDYIPKIYTDEFDSKYSFE